MARSPVKLTNTRLVLLVGVLLVLGCTTQKVRSHSSAPEATSAPETSSSELVQSAGGNSLPTTSRPAADATVGLRGVQPQVAITVPPVIRPDEDIIPAHETPADSEGVLRRERLVRRDFRYPLIRIEETIERRADGDRVRQRLEMVADHVLVSVAPGVGRDAIEQMAKRHGMEVRARMRSSGNYLLSFAATDHQALSQARAALKDEPALRVVEPDYVVHHMVTPDDPQYGQLWGLHNTGQSGGVLDADIDAPEAWDLGTGSHTVTVGVIDTGIDYTHPDLAANIWTNPGESGNDALGNNKRTNGIDDDGNGYIDDWRGWDFVNNDNNPMDDHYHGTHCAGTIGAVGGNGTGITGVCWQVSLVGLKFLSGSGSGTTSDAIEAIVYATQLGLDLTSNSWGGGGFSQTLKDAIDAAGAQGKLFVAAAGNSSSNNDLSPSYPASYTSSNIIAVAATSRTDGLASFSSYGATSVDLGAPGVDIYSTKPGNTYGLLSGTSMATPHVAGACAFLKSINPGLTAAQIKTALLTYTNPIASLQGKVLTNGRLNLAAAAVSVSGPHLVAEAIVLADDPVVDGIISPGETVSVTVSLRNVGSDPASNVTGTLTTANGFLSITQALGQYGNIAAGAQAAPDQNAVVVVSAPLTTPLAATMSLVVTGQDPQGDAQTWTIPVNFTIATASTISGQVVRTTGGAPVAGATVAFSGPSAGTVITAADGTFSRVVMDGVHTLVASAADLSPSAPQVITTPPGQDSVLFSLGAPDIALTPSALTVVVGQGETATGNFVIANEGDQSLTANLQVQAGLWQNTGLWHRTAYRDYDGGQSWYYGIESTRNYNTGSRNFGELTSPAVSVPSDTPVLTFWSWRVTEAGSSFDRSLVQVKPQGSATWTTVRQITNTSGTWQRNDIDLLAYAGQTIQVRFAFDTIDSYANSYEGWYIDAVTIDDVPIDGWMTLDDYAVTLSAGEQQQIGVTVTPGNRAPGSYTQNVVVSSNDPDEAQVTFPVTMLVEGRPSLVMGNKLISDGALPAIGDGDGFPEADETVMMALSLINQGGAAAENVSAVLSTSDTYVSVLTATSDYDDIPAGGTLAGTPFLLQIAGNCPLNHNATFTCIAQDGAGRTWTFTTTMTVVSRSSLTGVVSDLTTTAGIANATVSVGGLSSQSGTDGSYQIHGLLPGTWTANVSATGYSPQSTSITVPGDAQWDIALGAPQLSVTPSSLSAVLQYGESVTHQVQIANPGNMPLTWSMSMPNDPNNYVIDTSDQVGGPAYVWNDIRTTGTAIVGLGDDTNQGAFPLGFTFPFYGQNVTSMRVCSNGWISPTSTSTSLSGQVLPSIYAPRPLIAFYWRDLYFYAGSTAHYQQVNASTFVLQFTNVGLYGSSTQLLTCQVVLKVDGSITMYYQRVDSPNYGTVGIQNAAGTVAKVAAHNQAFLHNNMAVRFRAPVAGVTISPTSGTVAPGENTTVAVTVDSVLRGIGLHQDILTVTSNAPTNNVVQIPMTTRVIFGSLPVVNPQTVVTNEDVPAAFTLTATDGDGDPLTFKIADPPDHGVLSGTLPNLVYTPALNWSGSDSITVVVSDPYQTSDPVIIPITVTPVNDPPSLSNPFPARVAWVGQSFSANLSDGATISDPDIGDEITLSLVPISRPWPAGLEFDPETRVLSGTPTIDALGVTAFTVTATDSAGATATASLHLDVRAIPSLEKLLADDGEVDHRFATDVAIADGDIIIGAPWATERGQVYHFRKVSEGWQQQVIMPVADSDTRFGAAVAIEGDVLVIGSTQDQHVVLTTFARVEAGWAAESTQVISSAPASVLPIPDSDPDHLVDLSLSDGRLAVGMPFDGSGSVRLFIRDGSNWTQVGRVSGGNQFHRLGWSVDLDGELLLAGAPRTAFPVADAGAALLIAGLGTPESEMTMLTSSTFGSNYGFGTSVAVDGDCLVIGEPGAAGTYPAVGFAHVFKRTGGVWLFAQGLAPGITYAPPTSGVQTAQARFGSAVALMGNRLMVGAPGEGALAAGSVHGYADVGTGSFVRVQLVGQPDPANAARFGQVLAMDRDRVVVATPFDDDRGSHSGSAYVLTMNANHAPTLPGVVVSVTQDSQITFAMTPADADGDAVSLRVVTQPEHGTISLSGTSLTYVPTPGFTGVDAVQVIAEDGSLMSPVATVAITVTPYPTFYLTQFLHPEGDEGTNHKTLRAWLTIPSTEAITVAWSTHDGGGLAGSDYVASSGSLMFAPGITELTFTIPVIGDTLVEHDEAVPIAFTSESPVILPLVEPTLIIANDDANTDPVIAEGATIAVICDEDNLPQSFALTLHASDTDVGHEPFWQVESSPTHGEVVLSEGATVDVGYTPTADYHGSDSFELRAVDGYGGKAVITVTVTIRPRNDAPEVTVLPEITVVTLGNHASTLHATTGTWNDARDLTPGTITYQVQWQRAFDALGTGVSNIPGATSWDYTTTRRDRGRFLRVRVTASDDGEAEPTIATAVATSAFMPEPSLDGAGGGGSSGSRCGSGSGFSAFALLLLMSLVSLRWQRHIATRK